MQKGLMFFLIVMMLFAAPSHNVWSLVLNSPYSSSDRGERIYYSSIAEQPKTLDPANSYSSNEFALIAQIYEPLLQFDYVKRPYILIPLLAESMPEAHFMNKDFQEVSKQDPSLEYTVYRISMKKGMLFQPHPAFAKNAAGQYIYLSLPNDYIEENSIYSLSDFKETGTREITVDDYIYQIKRMADPSIGSAVYGLMSSYILGFSEYGKTLPDQSKNDDFIDLRKYPMAGLKKIDDYTFEIITKGYYPQFLYWLAMPFFSPIPWEADAFYRQPGMTDHNLALNWFPVGSGPFMMLENNPNRSIILIKNPNARKESIPENWFKQNDQNMVWNPSGNTLPFIDKAVYVLEKEAIPRWNKFLQGYYDLSGIATDSFDEAISINNQGKETLTPLLKEKNIRLIQSTQIAIYYLGFNMLDPIVGQSSERARLLRQAISIAVNYEENISIFLNGRGVAAQGPIPPGILGYRSGEAGMNPYVYDWVNGHLQRKSLDYAKNLLKKAGYPNGIDPKTQKPLVLYYDIAVTGGPDDKPQLEWMRKQFMRLGIELNIRGTLYNRFQDKISQGNAQIFSWGWLADYPDPENFLFSLYGKNGKVKYGGENASNYLNPVYDNLFIQMKKEENPEKRQKIIDDMVKIVQHDSPWAFGFYPKVYTLIHSWVSPIKPDAVIQNNLKYLDLDVKKREYFRDLWNQLVLWPFILFLLMFVFWVFFGWLMYRHHKQSGVRRFK